MKKKLLFAAIIGLVLHFNMFAQKGYAEKINQLNEKGQKVGLWKENRNKYECYIANDNSLGQIVLSGKIEDLEKMMLDLKTANIKNIKLPVSAPFHCKLMNKATVIMNEEITKLNFREPSNI